MSSPGLQRAWGRQGGLARVGGAGLESYRLPRSGSCSLLPPDLSDAFSVLNTQLHTEICVYVCTYIFYFCHKIPSYTNLTLLSIEKAEPKKKERKGEKKERKIKRKEKEKESQTSQSLFFGIIPFVHEGFNSNEQRKEKERFHLYNPDGERSWTGPSAQASSSEVSLLLVSVPESSASGFKAFLQVAKRPERQRL